MLDFLTKLAISKYTPRLHRNLQEKYDKINNFQFFWYIVQVKDIWKKIIEQKNIY